MQHPLAGLDEIPEDDVATIDFFGREVLVTKIGGRPRAIVNTCMHLGGPLALGDGQLVCQWHGAAFNATTCVRERGPAGRDSKLMVLPTRVIDGVLTYVYDSDSD